VDLARFEAAVLDLAARGELNVPPQPAVALRVQEALGRGAGLAQVAQLVGADAALTAAILRCANSALYRRGDAVTDLHQAITRIGVAEVQRLLLASGLAAHAQALGPLVALRRLLWIEGLAGAAICQELARLRDLRAEEAFLLGLLHDFGAVVAASAVESLVEQEPGGLSRPLAAWAALLERLHVPVGLAVAERWKLPQAVREVIAAHHGSPAGRCRDPRLLEVVVASDEIVARLLVSGRVTHPDLEHLRGVASAEERAAVERLVEKLPELIAAFETPASSVHVASPSVEAPETTLPGERRAVRLEVSVSVARRTRRYTAVELHPDGLVLEGGEPLPENRLLEAAVAGPEPFTAWVLTRLCTRTAEGFRAEVHPFAMSPVLRQAWAKLAAE
jgi:HD-like signal output (HDOD) protein